MRLYLIANGVNFQDLYEEEVIGMQLMWNAGLIGNQGVMRALGTLTCVQINKALSKHVKAYELKDVMPDFVEMTTRVPSKEEQKQKVNDELVRISRAPSNLIEFIQQREAKRGVG